jgi:tetratricopeptide (TPR) repeat protein
VWLGLCMARLGNFAEGLPHMQRAIALDPDQGIWHCYYAEALKLQKDVIRAKKSIDVAISLDPEQANFHIELAEILVIAYREKQNDLEQMLHDIPEGLDPNRPQLLSKIAALAVEANELALAAVDRALRLEPENRFALIMRMNTLYDLQRVAETQQAAEALLAVDPNSSNAHSVLGSVHRCYCRWPEAIESYQMALSLQPDCEATRANLVYVMAQMTPLVRFLDRLNQTFRWGEYRDLVLYLSWIACIKILTHGLPSWWMLLMIPAAINLFGRTINLLLLSWGWIGDRRYRQILQPQDLRSMNNTFIAIGAIISLFWAKQIGWLDALWRWALTPDWQNILAIGLLSLPLLLLVLTARKQLWQNGAIGIGIVIIYATDLAIQPRVVSLLIFMVVISTLYYLLTMGEPKKN